MHMREKIGKIAFGSNGISTIQDGLDMSMNHYRGKRGNQPDINN